MLSYTEYYHARNKRKCELLRNAPYFLITEKGSKEGLDKLNGYKLKIPTTHPPDVVFNCLCTPLFEKILKLERGSTGSIALLSIIRAHEYYERTHEKELEFVFLSEEEFLKKCNDVNFLMYLL